MNSNLDNDKIASEINQLTKLIFLIALVVAGVIGAIAVSAQIKSEQRQGKEQADCFIAHISMNESSETANAACS